MSDVDGFVAALREADVALSGLNFFAGDMPAGERGILSSPARDEEFYGNVAVVRDVADATGCRVFNALYGNRLDGESPERQDAVALERLATLADFTDATGSVVVLEPLSAVSTYPLLSADDAIAVITKLRATGATTTVKLLADLYHLAVNGENVAQVITESASDLGHVQIADAPGRNEPGTGELPIAEWLDQLWSAGYDGRIGLEYRPSTTSLESFDWLTTSQ